MFPRNIGKSVRKEFVNNSRISLHTNDGFLDRDSYHVPLSSHSLEDTKSVVLLIRYISSLVCVSLGNDTRFVTVLVGM